MNNNIKRLEEVRYHTNDVRMNLGPGRLLEPRKEMNEMVPVLVAFVDSLIKSGVPVFSDVSL